ncbi:hypothetical protein B0T22DRAFT_513785 [Podospora appendiculata]|uniref:Uncharacterized protein n=1 Tax=Podospora appendiculata TaxID=314037 RepID=A0AAE0XBY2_9PEZI|nr:hypothetical protein B0T22DRAFT_513785 [Podospora appendiculata]
MAEAIALAASVTAIVQIADRVIGVCKHYIRTARDAPSDLRTILVETSTLKTYQTDVSASVGKLVGDSGPIQLCLQAMAELESLLSSSETASARPSQTRTKRQRVKETITALAWPLKEFRARKLLEDVTRCKETVTLALSAELVRNVKFVKQKVVEAHQILDAPANENTESQRHGVLRWLERTDPSPIHVRNHKIYEPQTGNWIKRSAIWSNWSPNRKDDKVACVYYYCYFGYAQDETAPFLRWVISQLCRQVFIIIDALDESSTPRDDMLKLLRDFVHDPRFHKIQLIASSREYVDIEKAMEFISTSVPMDNGLVEVDIRTYLRSGLASNTKFSRWPRDLLAEVEDVVSKKARGMFRWAVCQVHAIAKLRPDYEIVHHELATLPKTLDETSERVFLSIDEEEQLFVSHVLKWIYFYNELGFESMTCANLILAAELSLKDKGGYVQNTTTTKMQFASYAAAWLPLRIKKCSSIGCNTHSSLFYFAHYTVLEYLLSPRIATGPAAVFALHGDTVEHDFTKIVMTEAQSPSRRQISQHDQEVEVLNILHEDINSWCELVAAHLASGRWQQKISCQADLRELAFELFNLNRAGYAGFSKVIRMSRDRCSYASGTNFPYLNKLCGNVFSPIHMPFMFFSGLWSPFGTTDRKEWNLPGWEGEQSILSKLLTLKADPNLEGYCLTPLQIATACSDEAKVRLLLGYGADAMKTGKANGITWREKSLIGRHSRGGNFLSSFSEVKPLDICRQLRSTSAFLITLDVGYDVTNGKHVGELRADYGGGEVDEDRSREMRQGYRYLANKDASYQSIRLLEANLAIEKLLLENGALDKTL